MNNSDVNGDGESSVAPYNADDFDEVATFEPNDEGANEEPTNNGLPDIDGLSQVLNGNLLGENNFLDLGTGGNIFEFPTEAEQNTGAGGENGEQVNPRPAPVRNARPTTVPASNDKNAKKYRKRVGDIRKHGTFGLQNRTKKAPNPAMQVFDDGRAKDIEKNDEVNEADGWEKPSAREKRRENVIESSLNRSKATGDAYALYENLEDNIRGDHTYEDVISGNTCDDRMDNWINRQVTAVEKNCIKRSVENCVDIKRMEDLQQKIAAGESAEKLNVKDYEVVQLARSMTQHYRSLIGKAMNMIVKIQTPGFKKLTEQKQEDGGAKSVFETGDVDDGRRRKKKKEPLEKKKTSSDNEEETGDNNILDFLKEDESPELTDDQKKQIAEVKVRLSNHLKKYSRRIEHITKWAIDKKNIEFLIPRGSIPDEDIAIWNKGIKKELLAAFNRVDMILDIILEPQGDIATRYPDMVKIINEGIDKIFKNDAKAEDLKRYKLERNRNDLGNAISAYLNYILPVSKINDELQDEWYETAAVANILHRRIEIMTQILRDQFNISTDEINDQQNSLTQVVAFDYTQVPGVKKIKSLKIELGTLSSCKLYQNLYDTVNPRIAISHVIHTLAPLIVGLGDSMTAEKSHQYSVDYFKKQIKAVVNNSFNDLCSFPDFKTRMRVMSNVGIIPPPMAQSTYLVEVRGRSTAMCNMLMWPDRLLWSYNPLSKGNSKGTVRAFIYSDYLDPFYRSWRQSQHGSEGESTSKIRQYREAARTNTKNTTTFGTRAKSATTTNNTKDLKTNASNSMLWNMSHIDNVPAPYKTENNPSYGVSNEIGLKPQRVKQADVGGYLQLRNKMREKHKADYESRLRFGLNRYPSIKSDFVYVGDRESWNDIFSDASGQNIKIAPSEHTVYTENWSNSYTTGSYVTFKQHVIPHLLDPKLVQNNPDVAGSAIYMSLVSNPSKPVKQIWFKDRFKLRKGKKSSKDEKELSRWEGWFPYILELDAICEGGNPGLYTWDRPEWMLLMFKSLASFLYKMGEKDAMKNLLVVRLNKLQMAGNVDYQKVIYLLRKYLDFAVAIDWSIQGEDEGFPPMYEYFLHDGKSKALEFDYVMFDRKWMYATVKQGEVASTRTVEGKEVPNVEFNMYQLMNDPTEPWLICMMPSVAQLFKALQFYVQDYMQSTFGGEYIRNFYDFVYADPDMISGALHLATVPGKTLREFVDFTQVKLRYPHFIDPLGIENNDMDPIPDDRRKDSTNYDQQFPTNTERTAHIVDENFMEDPIESREEEDDDNTNIDISLARSSNLTLQEKIHFFEERVQLGPRGVRNDARGRGRRGRGRGRGMGENGKEGGRGRKVKRVSEFTSRNKTIFKIKKQLWIAMTLKEQNILAQGLIALDNGFKTKSGTSYENAITGRAQLLRGLLGRYNVQDVKYEEGMDALTDYKDVTTYTNETGTNEKAVVVRQPALNYMDDEFIRLFGVALEMTEDYYNRMSNVRKVYLGMLRKTNIQQYNREVRSGIEGRTSVIFDCNNIDFRLGHLYGDINYVETYDSANFVPVHIIMRLARAGFLPLPLGIPNQYQTSNEDEKKSMEDAKKKERLIEDKDRVGWTNIPWDAATYNSFTPEGKNIYNITRVEGNPVYQTDIINAWKNNNSREFNSSMIPRIAQAFGFTGGNSYKFSTLPIGTKEAEKALRKEFLSKHKGKPTPFDEFLYYIGMFHPRSYIRMEDVLPGCGSSFQYDDGTNDNTAFLPDASEPSYLKPQTTIEEPLIGEDDFPDVDTYIYNPNDPTDKEEIERRKRTLQDVPDNQIVDEVGEMNRFLRGEGAEEGAVVGTEVGAEEEAGEGTEVGDEVGAGNFGGEENEGFPYDLLDE